MKNRFYALVTIGFVIISFMSLNIYAQTVHTSATDGLWSAASTWNEGVPDLTNNTLDITIQTGDTVTADAALSFKKASTITIDSGAMLIIDVLLEIDILDVAKDFTIIVIDGGRLVVNGNFDAAKDAALTITGIATFTGNVTLGQNATLTVNLPGSLSVTGNLSTGAGSTLVGTGPVSVGGTVTGPVTGDTQLPIELTYFQAHHSESSVNINWQTATEKNNDYFTLERSKDGINYETIGTVGTK